MLSYQTAGWLLVGKWDVLGAYELYMRADNDECWLQNTVQVISSALFINIFTAIGAVFDQCDQEATVWGEEEEGEKAAVKDTHHM